MSDLSFQRGEILTASKLNQLVQAVTSGAPSAAVGNGNVPPAQPHQVRQREFSSYVPVRRPIYIDQTSPHWPLANGSPGWYWREDAGSALTRFPFDLSDGDSVYLKTELSMFGHVQRQTPQIEPSPNRTWNPYEEKDGVICEKLGVVAQEPYKAGTKSTTMQFFEAPASPVIPVLLVSPPSTPTPNECWIPSFMPPATYLERASLLGESYDNTQTLKTINSDGGLIFKQKSEWYGCAVAEAIEIIPRLAILQAPSTAPPGTTVLGVQLPPGSWHEMAAVDIAGQRLALNMAWVNPWMAYINLAVSGGSGETLHQTWQKNWGMPAIDSPPWPFVIGSQAWHEVSRTPPKVAVIPGLSVPSLCLWYLQEEKILQAHGTYVHVTVAPGTNETGTAAPGTITEYQPMLFQAYLRRQLAPTVGCWCVWYDKCWTTLYD